MQGVVVAVDVFNAAQLPVVALVEGVSAVSTAGCASAVKTEVFFFAIAVLCPPIAWYLFAATVAAKADKAFFFSTVMVVADFD